MSGRWIEQHPTEMQQLIDLSRMPGVGITWGLHSWEHPKEQPFMNTFSPAVLRRDTLRLERLLLEWGIVPSVFYRFPGLVHDAPRLRTIAGMDLVAVDCDSWVASMELNQPPHRLPATDGSILLVHGNGNERRGIERLEEWLKDNPDIRLAPIHRFVQQGDVREEQKRNPVRPE
jgi:peptidoglycan/xylan/chitin deacetylase (PgdA/CDA1 family)